MRNTPYAGVLLQYFLVEDPSFEFLFVIGIREYEQYPLQLIRTVPVTSIDEEFGIVETLFCTYRLGLRITDINEQNMYLRVFEDVNIRIEDNEVIGPTLVLTLQ